MLGVVFLSCPGLLVPSLRENDPVLMRRAELYPDFGLGVTVALCGSVASGFAYFTMRKLGTQVNPVTTTFYFGVFSVPFYLLVSSCL